MDVKVGIVGLGDGGQSNLKSLLGVGAEIVALADRDEKLLGSIGGSLINSPLLFRNTEDLVRGSDAELIVVATPDDQHLAPAVVALEAGRYVFVEKPVATTREDLEQFNSLVKKYPSRILFSEKYSFARPVQAALARRGELGMFMCGSTFYVMWKCDRIMGGGKWRTEHAYNPCAGGLSHNFMTALLFSGAPIVRICATGQVITYHENLDRFGGYDTMEGTIEFTTGRRMNWLICLAVRGSDSAFAHRTVAHTLQFEHGSLSYGPTPESDRLVVNGERIEFISEPSAEQWSQYNLGVLYREMHQDILASLLRGERPQHNIFEGINVAWACLLAFESAKRDGAWLELPV